MSKVKLELQNRSYNNLRHFSVNHRDAMAGNVNFPNPDPTVAVYDSSLNPYLAKLDQITIAEIGLLTLQAERDTLRSDLEEKLSARGEYVERTAAGVGAIILSAAFDVQADGTATTSIAKPENVSATMGDNPGEIDVSCNAVRKAMSYIYEVREHSDVAAPGPWSGTKVGTRSGMTFSGLVSGTKYSFRIRALGPNELESPWSEESICMAP